MLNMLKNVDVAKLKLPDSRTIENAMKSEIKRLKNLLQAEIDRWYSAYSPVQYPRTNSMRNSIYAEDVVKIAGGGSQLTVSLKYLDSAYHRSLWSNQKVNVLYLENFGYHVSHGWHKDIPYFGYRSPGGFLEKAVEEFNRTSDLGFKANLHIPTSLYR